MFLNGLPGGAGLSILEAFIKVNSGKIQIISDFGFFERNFSKSRLKSEVKENMLYRFPGTIITLEINLDDNTYILAGDADDEINKILQGDIG